ncbi:hypothetical protein KC19_VG094500, partial [Ceratodon purpureus]
MEGISEDTVLPCTSLQEEDKFSEAGLTIGSVAANFESNLTGAQGQRTLASDEDSVRRRLNIGGSRSIAVEAEGGLYQSGEGITAGPIAENLLPKQFSVNAD